MAVNIPGLIMMVVFYLLVLGTGIWASVKSKRMARTAEGDRKEIVFLGNRGINLVLGIFTTTATWIGGGFIIGVAESVYNPTQGLIWSLVALQESIAFIIGALFFAKPMRDNKYVTMMDPFQIKYGKVLTAFLAVISVMTDTLFVTGTLTTLGVTMSVILDVPYALCIWISAAVATIYTLLGGLYSVAYTDVIQLTLIFFSMWLCLPFLMVSDVYTDITKTAFNHTNQASWLGHLEPDLTWIWIDRFLLMVGGSLALQDLYQRILSSSSTSTARITCFAAAGIIIILGIPPVLIGAVAASTDWNLTSYGSPSPYERGEENLVLPITLLHLTPPYISIFGIAATAAAVMSTADSCILAAVSVFTTNIYSVIRKQASDKELQWVIRGSVLIVGLVSTSLTFLSKSVMVFWTLCNDMTYTIMLPQLVCVLFFKVSNGYGAVIGYLMAVLMRGLSGDPTLGIPIVLCFPGCVLEDGVYVQRSPIRTICMLSSLVSILMFSYLASLLFNKGLLPERWDVFKVKSQGSSPRQPAAPINDSKEDEEHENPEVENEDDQVASEPMLESKC